jgi:glycosyltransferase involved in cell wall biosynthesis
MRRGPVAKVLHIVEHLSRGAVENWLVRMLAYAHALETPVDWTFYCVLGAPGILDDKVRAFGVRIVRSPVPLSCTREFLRALRSELRQGNYDVVHCHHDIMSAVYLLAATGIPVRQKIVHVHNADEALPTPSLFKKRLFREPMRHLCLMTADRIVGISNHTLDAFLSGRPRRPKRDCVHYYGIDPKPFEGVASDRARFRRECNFPDDALILLFAGRIVPEKNPVFVVDVLASLRRMRANTFAVFAGSGSQVENILARAKVLGLEDAIRMLGWRNDLPEVMSCCDWFVLPHPEHPPEGFGLAIVEAQLAGLRLLLSRGVLDDPLLAPASYRRLSLSDTAPEWAKAAIELLGEPVPSRSSALAALGRSPMNMDRALTSLLSLYT